MNATQHTLFQQIASLLGPLANPEKIKTLMQGAKKREEISADDSKTFREIAQKLSKLPELLNLGNLVTQKKNLPHPSITASLDKPHESVQLEKIKSILTNAGLAFSGCIQELTDFLKDSFLKIYPDDAVTFLENNKEPFNLVFPTSDTERMGVLYNETRGYNLALNKTGELLARCSNPHTAKDNSHQDIQELVLTTTA